MKVSTDSERARRRAEDGARTAAVGHAGNRLHPQQRGRFQWAAKLGVGKPRFEGAPAAAPDASHAAITVNLDACIQCTRCVRACRDEQVNDVIGLAFRGEGERSCSTWTTRWATPPAWPAANACRPARPAR
jgi:formate dehydrogenase major subunit